MANERTALASFIHISDLHIGSCTPEPLRRLLDETVFRWLDGLLGHDTEACVRLYEFYDETKVRTGDDKLGLIVTGDLTSWAKVEQFRYARDFLGSETDFGDRDFEPVGLSESRWGATTIPGNHDHWPGTPLIVGPPSAALAQSLNACPKSDTVVRLGSDLSLRFLCLNTDADVRPYSPARLFAQGAFQSQLNGDQSLSDQLRGLEPETTHEVRVLLLHHCRTHRAEGRVSGPLHTLEMLDGSRSDLEQFVQEHKVAVLLNGHVHKPRIEAGTIGGTTVLEARCGTTTQKIRIPEGWADDRSKQMPYRRSDNTLLLHQIYEENGAVYWHATTYVRVPMGGFVHHGKLHRLPSSFSSGHLDGRIKIWPV